MITFFCGSLIPIEQAPEGQKAKYIAAFKSTRASVPTREYGFTLTQANAWIGKRSEGGEEEGSKVAGAYDRDVLNENGKLLLGCAEDNKLAFCENVFLRPQK